MHIDLDAHGQIIESSVSFRDQQTDHSADTDQILTMGLKGGKRLYMLIAIHDVVTGQGKYAALLITSTTLERFDNPHVVGHKGDALDTFLSKYMRTLLHSAGDFHRYHAPREDQMDIPTDISNALAKLGCTATFRRRCGTTEMGKNTQLDTACATCGFDRLISVLSSEEETEEEEAMDASLVTPPVLLVTLIPNPKPPSINQFQSFWKTTNPHLTASMLVPHAYGEATAGTLYKLWLFLQIYVPLVATDVLLDWGANNS